MSGDRSPEIFFKHKGGAGNTSTEECRLSPWLFQNQDIIPPLQSSRPVDQKSLTNMLNHLHFLGEYLHAHLRHSDREESILVRIHPEPCLGTELTCHWSEEDLVGITLEDYQYLHLVIDDGQSMMLVPAGLQKIDGNSLTVQLPETSYVIGQRSARRYSCHEVVVELIQSGFQTGGELLDFSPVGFRIRVSPASSSFFRHFNSDAVVTVTLRHEQNILFSGACQCIRQQGGARGKEIVLIPANERINRFEGKRIRNPRQHIAPSFSIVFNHPFLKRRFQLGVSDISTSGFSVYEKSEEGVLIQGMIIPELIINFAGAVKMKCAAQVIYRLQEKGKGVRCGLSILDMDISTYSRLTHILANALDPHAYITTEVDMDSLWEFFFESGFIYPTKYRVIQSHRENFKKTYKKIYQEGPEIERHFTYQKDGIIYGHISMVRAYDKAWMIHHHAARHSGSKRAGLLVLKQIMHYLNDMHRLPSANMDHVISYFRPENKFPDRVFGGFSRELDKRQGCSMDLFAYLPYTGLSMGLHLPDGWHLKEASTLDFWNLNRFYGNSSGGLLLDAFQLNQTDCGNESLEEIYGRLGFLRKWETYSLNHKGELNAVLIVNRSELGLNLSELLNGITVIVTKPEDLPWNVLSIAIGQLTGDYHMERVPVLFYPFDYVTAEKIPYEKRYQLWVLDVRYGNEYMEYMQRKFRIHF